MKLFSKLIFLIVLIFSIGFSANTQAGWLSDLMDSGTPNAYICQGEGECGIEAGVEVLKGNLNDIETEKSASEYIQDIIVFLIGFIAIIAVVYIIYAGFNILTGVGDEEKMKKSKNIIIYVIVGLTVIFLSYSIVAFVFNVFDQAGTV